jgi:hypothetical protein
MKMAHLVSLFPRSVEGYFAHYLRVLLGYQMGRSGDLSLLSFLKFVIISVLVMDGENLKSHLFAEYMVVTWYGLFIAQYA